MREIFDANANARSAGFAMGYSQGEREGREAGFRDGHALGYESGWNDGAEQAGAGMLRQLEASRRLAADNVAMRRQLDEQQALIDRFSTSLEHATALNIKLQSTSVDLLEVIRMLRQALATHAPGPV